MRRFLSVGEQRHCLSGAQVESGSGRARDVTEMFHSDSAEALFSSRPRSADKLQDDAERQWRGKCNVGSSGVQMAAGRERYSRWEDDAQMRGNPFDCCEQSRSSYFSRNVRRAGESRQWGYGGAALRGLRDVVRRPSSGGQSPCVPRRIPGRSCIWWNSNPYF